MPSPEPGDGRPVLAIDGRMMHRDQCHGIARVTIEQMRRVPSDLDARVVLVLMAGASSRFDLGELSPSVEIHYTTSDIGRPYEVRDLIRVLRGIRADVLYSPYHALAPLHVPGRSVVAVHDCIMEYDNRLIGGRGKGLAYRANTARVLARAHSVVVPSATTGALLPTYYRRVPPITVCPNGVDPAFWPASERDSALARDRYRLPERYILHVGARRAHKNQRVLLDALALMPEDVGLVMVGHHDPRVPDDLVAWAHEKGVAGRTTVLDQVTDDELRSLYSGASVFAFPSTIEGFGLPVLEAMAAGVPVVASAIPVVAEVARGACLLVSPFSPSDWAAAMGSVLESTSFQDDLRARGLKVAAGSTWGPGAEALFDRLVSAARDDRPKARR